MTFFDEAGIEVKDWFSLRAVGSGTHFRGYVNKKLLIHGHADEAAAGRVGFRIEGNGPVLLDKIQVQAIQ